MLKSRSEELVLIAMAMGVSGGNFGNNQDGEIGLAVAIMDCCSPRCRLDGVKQKYLEHLH